MKKIFLVIIALLFCLPAYAGMQQYLYLFAGKWQPAEDPLLQEEFGIQDISNLRRDGNRLRGVNGHTRVNDTALALPYIGNGYHFKKDQPAESHIMVWSTDSTSSTSKVYDNTTAIPDAGEFEATALHTNESADQIGRFSRAPQGNVLYANGDESMIWGGDYYRTAAFIASTDSAGDVIADAKNFSAAIQNTSSDSGLIATVGSDYSYPYWFVGSTRPLDGVTYTMSSANADGYTLAAKEWDGDSWEDLSITDNTSGLSTNGSVLWASTTTTSKQKYLEGFILYWYQFNMSGGAADVSYVTVDAPLQEIKNNWDGSESVVGAFKTNNTTTWQEYTDEVNDNDTTYFAVLDSLNTTHQIVAGFPFPQQALNFRFLAGKENSTASVLTVKYWGGDSWVAVSNLVDGTSEGGATFGKTGVISWSPVAQGLEFERSIADETPLYYYQLTVSVQLDVEVELYYVTGIETPETIPGYRFPGEFQGRAFLFSETGGEQNKAIYSAYNSPDVWSGPDTGELFFGDEKKLTAAATIYNIFRTTGLEQLIVTKDSETYRVYGDDPSNWITQKMSSNIGCVAPLTMAVCDVSGLGSDSIRHVIMWMSDKGVVMCDGATVQLVSDDIKVYWDDNDVRKIPSARLDDAFGWYDSNLQVYKLLISSGTDATTNNIELEYDLKNNAWTKIDRVTDTTESNDLQAGFVVHDNSGREYSYGGTNDGIIYRLENGTTWQNSSGDGSSAIIQNIRTKDILPMNTLLNDTMVEHIRLAFEKKDGTQREYWIDEDGEYIVDALGGRIIFDLGEDIQVSHWCDGVESLDDEIYVNLPGAIDLSDGPFDTQDVRLGPCISHSFEFTGRITTVTDGMELTGLGIYYTPQRTISR